MIEAEITCVSLRLAIQDLGLTMTKGQVEYVEESKARGSRELRCLQRAGGVIVRFVRRSLLRRPASPPTEPEALPSPPPARPIRALPPAHPPVVPQIVDVDYEKLADKVAARLIPMLKVNQELADEVRLVLQAVRQPATSVAATVARRGESGEPWVERTFIPDVKVSEGFRGSILVDEDEGEAGSVNEAVAALRKARKESHD